MIRPKQELAALAYRHAPEQIIATVNHLIDHGNDVGIGVDETLQKVSRCWDDRLAAALLQKAVDPALTPQSTGVLLRSLLDRQVPSARALASELVALAARGNDQDRFRAVVAGEALMLHAEDAGWEVVWPAIQADPEIGDEVLGRVAGADLHADRVFTRLSEAQIADLYVWLARRYPHGEDPNPVGAHTVTARENIGRWRDYALLHLQRVGTREAIVAIRRIAAEFPDLEALQHRALEEAKEAMRRSTWEWPSPQHVLALTTAREFRLVHNADQLLEVVLESLHRLECKLQLEESRAVVDLWNVTSRAAMRGIAKQVLRNLRSKWGNRKPELKIDDYWNEFGGTIRPINSPKEENLLSDYVKRHLDDDLRGRGIVINREVQNRRRDITDIRIDAIERGTRGAPVDVVTAIVEVKGCWNAELDHAMRTQLVDRYLKPTGTRHGLYLIGWFNCDQWDSNDPRKAHAPDKTLDQARRHFAEQANALATYGVTVRSFVLDASLGEGVPHANYEASTVNRDPASPLD